jgi:hypothetical protein
MEEDELELSRSMEGVILSDSASKSRATRSTPAKGLKRTTSLSLSSSSSLPKARSLSSRTGAAGQGASLGFLPEGRCRASPQLPATADDDDDDDDELPLDLLSAMLQLFVLPGSPPHDFISLDPQCLGEPTLFSSSSPSFPAHALTFVPRQSRLRIFSCSGRENGRSSSALIQDSLLQVSAPTSF